MCWGGVPITKSEFQSPGHNMEKELVEMQNGGLDLFGELRDAKMLHSEDKRAFALREPEFGRLCDVQVFSRSAKQDWWFACKSRSV